MRLVYGEDERLIAWAAERIGSIHFRPDAKAIGSEINGKLVGVTVFDCFSPCDVNMHIASDGSGHWLTRAFLVAGFSFPFIQCGLRRVTGLVPAKNDAALRFDLHLGFKVEGRCRNALPNDDIIILGMTRSECRFISPEQRHD